MYDDEPLTDPFDPPEIEPDEFAQPSSKRGCLYLVVTSVIVASLLLSSILAYFVVTSRENRTETGGELSRPIVIETGPTAAPATVVAAVATPIPTTEPEPVAAIPDVNRIALINGDGQIETMSPGGENRRVLTLESDNTRFQIPTWAPDGRQVAIIGNRTVGGAIYVLDDAARTGALRDHQIYYSADQSPIYLYWAPDSKTLGFLANQSRDLLSLNVVAGDGTAESRQLATGAPFYWDWSDDGRQLLIHTGQRGAANSLALINLDGRTQADNLAIPGEFQAPGIGQGGRYWAFAEQGEGGLSSLVVVDTETGERSSHLEVGSLALSWSPARDQIAFTKGAVNGHPYWGPLHLLDVTTGEERLISTRTVLAFFWSPDGRQIAFITLGSNNDDDSINAGAPQKSRHVSRLLGMPVAQPGQGFLTLSVVDVETGQGLRLLDFEPTVAFLAQFLPYFDQYALSHRIWSPDSSAIVLPVREDGRNSIVILSATGGRNHTLAEGEIAFWSHN